MSEDESSTATAAYSSTSDHSYAELAAKLYQDGSDLLASESGCIIFPILYDSTTQYPCFLYLHTVHTYFILLLFFSNKFVHNKNLLEIIISTF